MIKNLKTKPVDHSLTYKKLTFRNFVHISRLNAIKKSINKFPVENIKSFADLGCSNGYITNILSKIMPSSKAFGFDRSENIAKANDNYSHITFNKLDLNTKNINHENFDLVTCFETLEHVGDIHNALENINQLSRKFTFISVPIEHGIIGIIKYLIKRIFYRYKLELKCSDYTYFKALIFGRDISIYREQKNGHGSHFGFDYRVIDEFLQKNDVDYSAYNKLTTRYYFIEK